MPISTTCSHCGKSYRVADALLGKTAKCRACGQTFTIDAPPEDAATLAESDPDNSPLAAMAAAAAAAPSRAATSSRPAAAPSALIPPPPPPPKSKTRLAAPTPPAAPAPTPGQKHIALMFGAC